MGEWGLRVGMVLCRWFYGDRAGIGALGGVLVAVGARLVGLGRLTEGTISALFLDVLYLITFTRATANLIGSGANRPVVNIGMLMGKAAGNAVASFSNGFSVPSIPDGTALIISCVKCLAGRIGAKGSLIVMLRRSGGALSRIIIVNCNAMGEHSLANSITSIAKRGLTTGPITGITRTLRKRLPNMDIASRSNHPNTNVSVHVHNNNSVARSGSPLFVMSNIRIDNVSSVPTSGVRDVSILGSTTSATVCNTHNTGNMVLIAAGKNGSNQISIGCGVCCRVGRGPGLLRAVSPCSCMCGA